MDVKLRASYLLDCNRQFYFEINIHKEDTKKGNGKKQWSCRVRMGKYPDPVDMGSRAGMLNYIPEDPTMPPPPTYRRSPPPRLYHSKLKHGLGRAYRLLLRFQLPESVQLRKIIVWGYQLDLRIVVITEPNLCPCGRQRRHNWTIWMCEYQSIFL